MKSIWTIETYAIHNEALRSAEEKFQGERDRRYAEVKSAEEKALKVKEEADRAALGLAREIQTYKDEKANELREQISSERGIYALKTDVIGLSEKIDALLRPLQESIVELHGHDAGVTDSRALIAWGVAILAGAIAIGSFVFRHDSATTSTPQPQIIVVPSQGK